MGIGVAALQTSQKKELAGPPFVSGSAENGLSVDAVSKKIVLGNNVGDPAHPGALISNREILTEDSIGNLFGLTLRAVLNNVSTLINGTRIILTGGNNTNPFMNITAGVNGAPAITMLSGNNGQTDLNLHTGSPGTCSVNLVTGNDSITMRADDSGDVKFIVSGVTVGEVSTNTLLWQFGNTLVAHNGANVQISGTATYRLVVTSKGAGAYNVDRDLDTCKLFTNSAANTFNLPDMSGGNNRSGFIFRLTINNAGGSTIQLFAGQTLRFGSLATSAGGTLSSTDVGATVVAIWTGSVWITETFNGVWTLT